MTTDDRRAVGPRVGRILQQLEAAGGVSVPGAPAGATARWLRRRTAMYAACVGAITVGAVALATGLLLRDDGVWALLILFGAFLGFVGLAGVGGLALASRLLRGRLRAEREPVSLDPRGVTLRGIGPIPWSHLLPPERRQVRVKNDIGGRCTVMPLTPVGHAVVNRQAGWWANRVGPKPYLRPDIPYLLLPGVEGLTEGEALQLFASAHQRFASAVVPHHTPDDGRRSSGL
ncbi:hypothetical protein [Microbacterium marinilacus]|uniref:DUF3239 domain-containing protein n=1 Tax=Microbacterium marinilacus TaxID=415209 RepID=A0ABP7B861_9MICO|nr:hypothetical protein [Microbacterium marinilacus]MBY0687459.1 hypothetical protein [Microbacterium marinilacus]